VSGTAVLLALVLAASPAANPGLLFSKLTAGTWQVWEGDPASGRESQLTASPGDKRSPVRLADGRVVFTNSNQQAFVLEGKNRREIPFLPSLWPLRDVAASAVDRRVAFARIRTDVEDNANLGTAGFDGSSTQQLTDVAGIQYNPAWSPDGTEIAFVGGRGPGSYELFVVAAEGGVPRRLTENASLEFWPSWDPKGRRIAFVSDATGDMEIWTADRDGGDARAITRSPGLDTRPAWSPDGSRLAFVTRRTGTLAIWSMNPDGSDARPLFPGDKEPMCDPSWR